MPRETRNLSAARLAARAPRYALLASCALLSTAGLRAAILPPAPGAPALVAARPAPAAVAVFAEAFAREYLTFDAADPGRRTRRLAGMLATGLDPDAGLVPASGATQQVAWAAAGTPHPQAAAGSWVVPVTAGLSDGRRVSVNVPVSSDAAGLVVSDYPALGALAARGATRAASLTDTVEDRPLSLIVARAVRNYLARRAGDLQADLAAGARVVTPDLPARLNSVQELAWTSRGHRLAALIDSQLPDGTRVLQRLHLTVTRHERWLITAIDPLTTTTTQGAPTP